MKLSNEDMFVMTAMVGYQQKEFERHGGPMNCEEFRNMAEYMRGLWVDMVLK